MKKNIIICFLIYFLFPILAFATPPELAQPAPVSPFGPEIEPVPVFAANDDTAAMTVPDQENIVINVLSNDSGSNLRITQVKKPGHGDAWQSGAWANPTITYQPEWNFIGTDSFEYSIKQNGTGKPKTATVTVTVNGPLPPVAYDNEATTDVRQRVVIPVLENDTGYKIEFDWDYPLSASHGEAWTSGKNIVYEPEWDYPGGTDTFTYGIQDYYGRKSNATITVNITVVDPPVANNDTASTDVRKKVTIPVLENDEGYEIDFDYDFDLNPEQGEAWTQGNNIVYMPEDNFAGGTDSFQYKIQDDFERTAEGTITVNVIPGPPVAEDDTATTTSGESVTIPVLDNDTGLDLTITSPGSPSHGNAEISGDSIIYTPEDGWAGTDTFTYTVQDSAEQEATGDVSVTVSPANQGEGMAISSDPINSNKNHSRIDGTQIKYLDSGTYNANTVIIRPKQKSGIISLDGTPHLLVKNNNYTITAESGQITVVLTGNKDDHRPMEFTGGSVSVSPMPEVAPEISAANDTYELENENTWYDLFVLDNDTGVGTLKVQSIDSGPNHGSAQKKNNNSPRPRIRYKYDRDYTGIDTLTYTMFDECGRTASAEVTIYCGITKINALDDTAATESGVPVTVHVLSNDSGESISIKSVDTPSNGNAEISGDDIVYSPPEDFDGTVTFSYTIEDEYDMEASANITVEVAGGGGGGQGGPLRQAIYTTMVDSSDMLSSDIETDTEMNNPNTQPALKILMYNKVFDHLAALSTDQQDELTEEERTQLQNNVVPQFSTLFNTRVNLENGSSEDTEAYNAEKNALKSTLDAWITANPDDNPES